MTLGGGAVLLLIGAILHVSNALQEGPIGSVGHTVGYGELKVGVNIVLCS